jgi:D,D-heptose 1,7-bisphosphate phosphatase
MNKAVFLDRDGVINEEVNFLSRKEDMKLISRSAEAIKLLNDAEYKVIVITNQPQVAIGMCNEEDINDIHEHMIKLLAEKDAQIDKVYYCPHHPTRGTNPKYTRGCICRKPNPGMILQAKKDLKIQNLEEGYIVGDKISDIKAGKLVGCQTILVKTGYGGKDGWKDAVPDYESEDLYDAVKRIILKK